MHIEAQHVRSGHQIRARVRGAHFHCALVYVRSGDDPTPVIAEGRWPGRIRETAPGDAAEAIPPRRNRYSRQTGLRARRQAAVPPPGPQ